MICDCNLKWFLELVQNELSTVQLAAACSSPEFEKRHIKSLSEEDLQCGEFAFFFNIICFLTAAQVLCKSRTCKLLGFVNKIVRFNKIPVLKITHSAFISLKSAILGSYTYCLLLKKA